MKKAVLIILVGLSFCPYYYSQEKTFGSRISGNGDIISDVFLIHEGFVLDSIKEGPTVYRFEYYSNGKLSRDFNIVFNKIIVNINGQTKYISVPGYRDYYYGTQGLVDSMLTRYWNDTLGVWVDNLTFVTYYHYDVDEKLVSKSYSNSSTVDEYNYDLKGNLIAINTLASGDTISTLREYDSQDRLLSIKAAVNGDIRGKQYIYQYDSTGNVNCLYRNVHPDKISNKLNYYMEFDESGKLTYEIFSSDFLADSTWGNNYEIILTYDENDRILENGPYHWFHYNIDGNLDSMICTHLTVSGYLVDKCTLVDHFGNRISFPVNGGEAHFYYRGLIAGFKDDDFENKVFALAQNYPNPFNPSTVIEYSVPIPSAVKINVYNTLGELVSTLVDGFVQTGNHKAIFDGKNLTSGVYYYQLTSGGFRETKKFVLIK